jgi:antitoxin (DNA-binding transcriptional repressor) of toxin-antitoxin stability system
MKKVNVREAKTQLSKLLQRVAAGEEIPIANRKVPVARLDPVALPKTHRELGTEREHVKIAEDFDAPLPTGVLTAFRGGQKKQKGRKQ